MGSLAELKRELPPLLAVSIGLVFMEAASGIRSHSLGVLVVCTLRSMWALSYPLHEGSGCFGV